MCRAMRSSMRARRRRISFAFTLVEVVVVVGILGLILATLLPMVQRARLSAKRTRLALDLNAIGIALDAYHDDFGDYPRSGGLRLFEQPARGRNPLSRDARSAGRKRVLPGRRRRIRFPHAPRQRRCDRSRLRPISSAGEFQVVSSAEHGSVDGRHRWSAHLVLCGALGRHEHSCG
jgi:type II secretory pathway pseudopilin PulG